MSRASNQFMTLLSTVCTTLFIIQRDAVPADERIKDLVDHALDVTHRLLENYPHSGDMEKNRVIIHAWLDEWKEADSGIGYDAAGVWHPVVLSGMSHRVMEDLSEKIRNPAILADIITLRECLNQISVVLMDAEPVENEHRLLTEAGTLVSEIYEIVGYTE